MPAPPLALAWRTDAGATRVVRFDDEPLVLGRDPSCDAVFESLSVSRRHAQIRRDGDRFVLRALSRTSPTRLNGRVVVRDAPLAAGDVVELAMVRLDVVAIGDGGSPGDAADVAAGGDTHGDG